ncbi:hypothetical protein B0H14DRAFT_2602208, partial [Mycena olivaceomarginata]
THPSLLRLSPNAPLATGQQRCDAPNAEWPGFAHGNVKFLHGPTTASIVAITKSSSAGFCSIATLKGQVLKANGPPSVVLSGSPTCGVRPCNGGPSLEPTSPTSPPTFSKRTGQKRLSRLVPSVDVSALSAVYTFAQKPHIMESELVAAFSLVKAGAKDALGMRDDA